MGPPTFLASPATLKRFDNPAITATVTAGILHSVTISYHQVNVLILGAKGMHLHTLIRIVHSNLKRSKSWKSILDTVFY